MKTANFVMANFSSKLMAENSSWWKKIEIFLSSVKWYLIKQKLFHFVDNDQLMIANSDITLHLVDVH